MDNSLQMKWIFSTFEFSRACAQGLQNGKSFMQSIFLDNKTTPKHLVRFFHLQSVQVDGLYQTFPIHSNAHRFIRFFLKGPRAHVTITQLDKEAGPNLIKAIFAHLERLSQSIRC